jgi:hypothetical protein
MTQGRTVQTQPTPHKLSLAVITPKVATEAVTFKIRYKVKNIGNTIFPGGNVTVEISWASLDQKVYQPIIINDPLAPNAEIEENRYSQAPLMAGYTWFHVFQAIANDGSSVEIYNTGGARIWPYQQIASGPPVQFLKQPAHAVHARTREETISKWALVVAAVSLAVLAAFQIIDWILKYYLHTG